MTIHEARHYHASVGAHLDGAAGRQQIFYPARRADFDQEAVANQKGPVLDDAKLVEFSPPPGCLGAAKSEKLARSPDQNGCRISPAMNLPYVLVRSAWRNACEKVLQPLQRVR